jgi:hypothetical protein
LESYGGLCYTLFEGTKMGFEGLMAELEVLLAVYGYMISCWRSSI